MPTAADDLRHIATIMEAGRSRPDRFIEHFMGAYLWPMQRTIARDVFANRRVAVKACHSSGKTHIAAHTVLAFFLLYPGCKVITTAPTWEGVERQLWGELATAFGKMPDQMREGFTLLQTELRNGSDWWAVGLSTNQGVRFQGHHAPRMLVVLDEANGIAADIWEAAESLGAGGDVHYLVIANPLIASGPFYDIFTRDRADWVTHTIDAFETPNLVGLSVDDIRVMDDAGLDQAVWPSLITRRYVRRILDTAGEASALWQSRVRGQFPEQSEDSLFSLAWLERARREANDLGGPIVAGVDVAGPGEDETVLVLRCGGDIIAMHSWSNPDSRGDVLAELLPFRDRLTAINVDSAGIGHYFAQHLRDQGLPVRAVNVGEKPEGDDPRRRWLNKRAHYFWQLRDKFESGVIAGLGDDLTISQLAGIRYEHDSVGRVVIESKEIARRRGVKSPDRADALMLCFCADTPASLGFEPKRQPKPFADRSRRIWEWNR